MFAPIAQLLRQDKSSSQRWIDRWNTDRGKADAQLILDLIRRGAGEDFLQSDFEGGRLPTLENMWDLRGYGLFKERIEFPEGDTFEGINFSHGSFHHCELINATFFNSYMGYGRVYGCTFVRCVFAIAHFYAVQFENCRFVNCDFFETPAFDNCDLQNTEFNGCWFGVSTFADCRLDAGCRIVSVAHNPTSSMKAEFSWSTLASVYRGIYSGFMASGATRHAFGALYQAERAETRSLPFGRQKALGWVFSFTMGYGLRPLRVIRSLALLLTGASLVFALAMPIRDAAVLAAGSLFTFGAGVAQLAQLSLAYVVAYILFAFLGICLTSTFVVVFARVHLAPRA
ncbi:pentapeptide repeat-containing protein [bacterium]|nr:pentapeptide repeat-containing protein [bacterium]